MSERLEDILRAASNRLYAGQVDPDALAEAVKLGYVRRVYEGAMGFMGCARLELTEEGWAAS